MVKLALIFLCFMVGANAQQPMYYFIQEGTYFYLKNVGSGQCAVAEGDGIVDGTRVVQFPCVTGPVPQKGRIVEFINQDGCGAYQIRNLLSGKCYVIHFASIANGFGIDEFACSEDLANSRWTIKNVDSTGAFQLVNSGSKKCLNVLGSSAANAALIGQWTCDNMPDKMWKLEAVNVY